MGDVSSIPGQGTKTQHAVEQLSPCAITTEPVSHNEKTPHDTLKILGAAIKT